MPVEQVPETDLTCYLVAFDPEGRERTDDSGGLMSRVVRDALASTPATDVFLFSHGWKGDLPSARADYRSWFGVLAQCQADVDRMRQTRPGFKPLLIGLHWPSQPWGDEEFGEAAVSFAPGPAPPVEPLVERYAARVADTPAAREALRTIFTAARQEPDPPTLPEEVRAAYEVLDREAGLGCGGVGARPGADRERFDPERHYEAAQAAAREEAGAGAVSFGFRETAGGLILSPLRQLSFWKMKDRARVVGEGGVHALLRSLQGARDGVRFHLMGHSFGCIVVSAAVAGPPGGPGLDRPVHAVVLVQGALSLWSYCQDIPSRPGTPGYFRPVVAAHRVEGPVVTTQSRFDKAVGRWYPLAAGAARQAAFAPGELPRYGGVGTFGLRGPGLDLADQDMQAADKPYDFQGGRIYNLESSSVIKAGGGASGAHSDIAHPEVGHVVWSAACAPAAGRAPAVLQPSAASFVADRAVPLAAPPPAPAGAELTVEQLLRSLGAAATQSRARVRVEIEIEPAKE
jgi:hypothetical protein